VSYLIDLYTNEMLIMAKWNYRAYNFHCVSIRLMLLASFGRENKWVGLLLEIQDQFNLLLPSAKDALYTQGVVSVSLLPLF
jgi:hypothetical protein